jgi:hypothetical protein
MAVTPNSIVTPQTPYAITVSTGACTACTTRGPTATANLAAANIKAFVPTSTNGRRIDYIRVKSDSTDFTDASVVQLIMIWMHDGTTAHLIKEHPTTVVTASTTVASYDSGPIAMNLVLPAEFSLYYSVSITTATDSTTMNIQAYGADL